MKKPHQLPEAESPLRFPSTVTYTLNPTERQALGNLARKYLRRKGDHRLMLLILARCALAHFGLLEPSLDADLRYVRAEGVELHDLQNRQLEARFKSARKGKPL